MVTIICYDLSQCLGSRGNIKMKKRPQKVVDQKKELPSDQQQIDIVLAKSAMERVNHYSDSLKKGLATPGEKLTEYCNSYLNKYPKDLKPIELLQALLRTKEPVIFTESQAKLDGSDWSAIEYEILCSAGIMYEVTTYDNGVWGDSKIGEGTWDHFKDYSDDPFKQLAMIVSAPLLTKNSPDYKRIVRDGKIDEDDYYTVLEERLLPLLMKASEDASAAEKLVLTLPGLGCSAFAGEFKGRMGPILNRALKRLVREHNAKLENIDTIVFDCFSECGWEEEKSGDLKYRVRSINLRPQGNTTGKALPQLSAAIEYEEPGDNFRGCKKVKIVAGDGCSLPNNDANAGSRNTDEGAFGAGTNSAYVLSSIPGAYEKRSPANKVPKYTCPEDKKWGKKLIDKKTELLPVIADKTLHIMDTGRSFVEPPQKIEKKAEMKKLTAVNLDENFFSNFGVTHEDLKKVFAGSEDVEQIIKHFHTAYALSKEQNEQNKDLAILLCVCVDWWLDPDVHPDVHPNLDIVSWKYQILFDNVSCTRLAEYLIEGHYRSDFGLLIFLKYIIDADISPQDLIKIIRGVKTNNNFAWGGDKHSRLNTRYLALYLLEKLKVFCAMGPIYDATDLVPDHKRITFLNPMTPTSNSINAYRKELQEYEQQKLAEVDIKKISKKHSGTYFAFLETLGVVSIRQKQDGTGFEYTIAKGKQAEFTNLLRKLGRGVAEYKNDSILVSASAQKVLKAAYISIVAPYKDDKKQAQLCKDARVKAIDYSGDIASIEAMEQRNERKSKEPSPANNLDKFHDFALVLQGSDAKGSFDDGVLNDSIKCLAISMELYLAENYHILSSEERECISSALELLLKEDDLGARIDCLGAHIESNLDPKTFICGGTFMLQGRRRSVEQPRFLHALPDEDVMTSNYRLFPVMSAGKVSGIRLMYREEIDNTDPLYTLCRYRYYLITNGEKQEVTVNTECSSMEEYRDKIAVALEKAISAPLNPTVTASKSLMLAVIAYMGADLPQNGANIGFDIFQKICHGTKKEYLDSLNSIRQSSIAHKRKQVVADIEAREKEVNAAIEASVAVEEVNAVYAKQFEKKSYSYIYVDKENKIHIIAPISGGSEIATDNTCKAALEINQFWGIGGEAKSKLTVFSNISRYIKDLENDIKTIEGKLTSKQDAQLSISLKEKKDRKEQLLLYKKLLNDMLQANDSTLSKSLFSGTYPAAVVTALSQDGANAVGMRLSPAFEDPVLRIANPVFRLKRRQDAGYSNGLAANLLSALGSPLCGSKAKAPVIPAFKDLCKIVEGCTENEKDVENESDLNNLKVLINQELIKNGINGYKFEGANRDRKIEELSLNAIRAIVSCDEDESVPAQHATQCLLIEDRYTEALFEANMNQTPFADIKDDRNRSISVQFFIGVANLYYYEKTGSKLNFGQVIESNPGFQKELVDLCRDYYGIGLEDKILGFINNRIVPSQKIPDNEFREIALRFRARYLQVKESPHFDEFLQLAPTKVGSFYGYLNCISIHISEFCKHLDNAIYQAYFSKTLATEIRHKDKEISDVMLLSHTGAHNKDISLEFETEDFNELLPERLALILSLFSGKKSSDPRNKVFDDIPDSLQKQLKSRKDWENVKKLLLSKLDLVDSPRFLKKWKFNTYMHVTPAIEEKIYMRYSEESSKSDAGFSIDDLTGKSRRDKLWYMLSKLPMLKMMLSPNDLLEHDEGGFALPCSIDDQVKITEMAEAGVDKIYLSTAIAESIYQLAQEKMVDVDIFKEYENKTTVVHDKSRVVIALQKLLEDADVKPDIPPYNTARHPYLLTSFAGKAGFYISCRDADRLQEMLIRIRALHYQASQISLSKEEVMILMSKAMQANKALEDPMSEELFKGEPSAEKLTAAITALGLGALGEPLADGENAYKISLEYPSLKLIYPMLCKEFVEQAKEIQRRYPDNQDIGNYSIGVESAATNIVTPEGLMRSYQLARESRVIYINYYNNIFKKTLDELKKKESLLIEEKKKKQEAEALEQARQEEIRLELEARKIILSPEVAGSIYEIAQRQMTDNIYTKYSNQGSNSSDNYRIIVAMRKALPEYTILPAESDQQGVIVTFLKEGFKVMCTSREEAEQLKIHINGIHKELCSIMLSQQEYEILNRADNAQKAKWKLDSATKVADKWTLSPNQLELKEIYNAIAAQLQKEVHDKSKLLGASMSVDNQQSITKLTSIAQNISQAQYRKDIKDTYQKFKEALALTHKELDREIEAARKNPVFEAYSCKHSDDLYFTMVKVTDLNREFWQNYCNYSSKKQQAVDVMKTQMEKVGKKISDHPRRQMAESIGGGMAGFFVFPKQEDGVEQWVTIASSKPIESNNIDLNDVEMTMMVTTKKDSPISIHMGISRNPWQLFKEKWNKNISMWMHKFAAKAMQQRYPDKTNVASSPIEKMTELFEAELGGKPGVVKKITVEMREPPQIGYSKMTVPLSDGTNLEMPNNDDNKWYCGYTNLHSAPISIDLDSLAKSYPAGQISHIASLVAEKAPASDTNLSKALIESQKTNTPEWILKAVGAASPSILPVPAVPALASDAETYSYKKSDNLYFTMVKVTDVNRDFWRCYGAPGAKIDQIRQVVTEQMETLGKSMEDHPRYRVSEGISSGLSGFVALENPGDGVEQWVAIASYKEIKDPYAINLNDIEMTMMVTTAKDVPFTVHMGISRSYYALFLEFWHKNLSLDLHAFAAKAMLKRYPEKTHMVSAPIKVMNEILQSKFTTMGMAEHMQVGIESKLDLSKAPLLGSVTLPKLGPNKEDLFMQLTVDDKGRHNWFFNYTNLCGTHPIVTFVLEKLLGVSEIGEIQYNKPQTKSKPPAMSDTYLDDGFIQANKAVPKWVREMVAKAKPAPKSSAEEPKPKPKPAPKLPAGEPKSCVRNRLLIAIGGSSLAIAYHYIAPPEMSLPVLSKQVVEAFQGLDNRAKLASIGVGVLLVVCAAYLNFREDPAKSHEKG